MRTLLLIYLESFWRLTLSQHKAALILSQCPTMQLVLLREQSQASPQLNRKACGMSRHVALTDSRSRLNKANISCVIDCVMAACVVARSDAPSANMSATGSHSEQPRGAQICHAEAAREILH